MFGNNAGNRGFSIGIGDVTPGIGLLKAKQDLLDAGLVVTLSHGPLTQLVLVIEIKITDRHWSNCSSPNNDVVIIQLCL